MTRTPGTFDVAAREGRRVTVARRTAETDVAVTVDLDGRGAAGLRSGIESLCRRFGQQRRRDQQSSGASRADASAGRAG